MPGVMIYAAGYVTNDLIYRESLRDERHDFLGFTMAHNSGFRADNGDWQQTGTLWLNVKAFGALARNARGVIAKGRPVLVHGELKHETFDGVDGHKHSSLDLKADGIGLNLRLCSALYTGRGEPTRTIAPLVANGAPVASGAPEAVGVTDEQPDGEIATEPADEVAEGASLVAVPNF